MKSIQLALALALSISTFTASTAMADNAKSKPEETAQPIDDKSACALPSHAETTALDDFKKSDAEWQKILKPDQFRVLRQQGTEPSFNNEYWNHKGKGVYVCAGCEAPLFASGHKFDSGTGWPSFWDAIEEKNVGKTVDRSYGMVRTEVHCNRCGGHLGHLFEDGPKPTRQRYCINSASIEFVDRSDLEERNLAEYASEAK